MPTNLCAVDAVIAESDCVDVWNLPNRVILASLPDPAVIQMMLVDRERRLLTIRNMPRKITNIQGGYKEMSSILADQ
jgi:hypothetical protein